MGKFLTVVISWLFAAWTSFVFLNSLRFKFDTTALEPAHIFNTIGTWMSDVISPALGDLFSSFGQYAVGIAELFTAFLLLLPILLWKKRRQLHFWGALLAVCVMTGAIFFHLFTPLGWHPTWAVSGPSECAALYLEATQQCSDTFLANAALSIFIGGIIVAILNRKPSESTF